jgi:adenylate cyclase
MAKERKKRSRVRFHWSTFILGLAVTAGFFALFGHYPVLLETLELRTADARMRARPAPPLSNDVAVIAIDDKSIQALGRWPWSRATMAQLQRAFIEYKVKVVAYDVLFTEGDSADVERAAIAERLRGAKLSDAQIQSIVGPDNDQQFAAAIKAQGNTLLGYSFSAHSIGEPPDVVPPDYTTELSKPYPFTWNVRTLPGSDPALMSAEAYRPPIPVLDSAAKKAGFVDADSDVDGLFRREMIAIRFHKKIFAPLFVAAVWAFEDYPNRNLLIGPAGIQNVTLGNTEIPVDEEGRMVVNYRGPVGTIPNYSASDVVEHKIVPDKLVGKLVLVGVTGHGLGDKSVTPVGAEFPRVEMHANAIETILTHSFFSAAKTYTLVVERLCAAAMGIGISIATAWLSAAWSIVAMAVLAASYFGFAEYLLIDKNVMLGMMQPFVITGGTAAILLGYRYITEGREKGYLRHAFEHYMHPDVIAAVVDDPEGLKLGGERRHLAILFADIVGFTSRAERSDPVQLVALLNAYMTRMTDIILESGGVVDKLMGDGIMAFWGAPNELENPSRSAIDAALRMLEALETLRREDERFRDLQIGIGIATGEAILGNFGGERRFDYSVIGDTVNFASRLEGLTRKFGAHLLVSKATFIEAANSYVAREIGLVRVKGKVELVPIVEVAGHAGDGVDPSFFDQFAGAVALLKNGNADMAREQLEKMITLRPRDEVIGLYLEKLREAKDAPPREMVFEFETK